MAALREMECMTLSDSDESSPASPEPSATALNAPSARMSASTIGGLHPAGAASAQPVEVIELLSEEEDEDDVAVLDDEARAAFEANLNRKRRLKQKKSMDAPREIPVMQPDYHTVASTFPLPKPPVQIVADDLVSHFYPAEARKRRMKDPAWKKRYEELAPVREKRRQEQRVRDGTDWKSYWSLEDVFAGELGQVNEASFFPYANFEGLEPLADVFATVSGSKVKLWRAAELNGGDESGKFDNCYDGRRASIIPIASTKIDGPESPNPKEDLLALAWSVNVSTWPYTPILAVGGHGRAVYIFNVVFEDSDETETVIVKLKFDRMIVGHGKAIVDLKFSLSHPHLLASASDDRTARLLDPTVPRPASTSLPRDHRKASGSKHSKSKKHLSSPPLPPPGETIAILGHDGHTKPLLSIDIHPTFPLVLTTGLDGQVLIWRIPDKLRGPTWPTTTLYKHPPPPTTPQQPPPILSAPIFTSSAIHTNWCDQALWTNSLTCHIISKATRAPSPGIPTSGTEIKLWIPSYFNRAPYNAAPRTSAPDDDPEKMARQLSERRFTFPDGHDNKPLSSAFQVYRRADLEDDNALGSRMGLHLRPSPADITDDTTALLETILFTPTANEPALYAFHPFGPPPPSTEPQTDSLSPIEELKERFESIEATGIDRLVYDWSPRLRPSAVLDVKMNRIFGLGGQSKGGKKVEELRFRCTTVQPNGAKWVAATGDGGLLMLWRRRKAAEVTEEPKPMNVS